MTTRSTRNVFFFYTLFFYFQDEQQPEELDDSPPPVDEEDLQAYADSVEENKKELHENVLQNVQQAQEKQKRQHQKRTEKGVKVLELEEGILVLKKQMKNVARKGDQMAHKWTGPYK